MKPPPHDLFGTLQEFTAPDGQQGLFYSLPQLERATVAGLSRLPISIRIILESVLRNYRGDAMGVDVIKELANWLPQAHRSAEIPFVVGRVLLHDTTGVPLLVDLAAMRSAFQRLGHDPSVIEPLVPLDLVADHSVQIDYSGVKNAVHLNMGLELQRNSERYRFLKWSAQAFNTLRLMPPGTGIMHQINMEYLASGVTEQNGLYYPDSLVGADSHTTMINGLGIVGWGVGGLEAEVSMLGQPIYFLMPDVVGVHLTGALRPGITVTDMALRITQMLREANVVGKFVEFHGDGAARLPVSDRAAIANMSPEYGATMGFFPTDEETCRYLLATGRPRAHVEMFRAYYQAQAMFGMPQKGDIKYSELFELDLATITPSVAGPKRPQDRIELWGVKSRFHRLLEEPVAEGGYGKLPDEVAGRYKSAGSVAPTRGTPQVPTAETREAGELGHGDIVIAAITSCTNTSNPSVMVTAGLLAKKAVERGLAVPPHVKTSLAPGSRVVTGYLADSGLQAYLDALGFQTAAYGCTTCIGNSGPLEGDIERLVRDRDLVVASVLSGNRNFEARVHQSVRANFLMSPPLVIAFALAGHIDIDLTSEPVGTDQEGKNVYLHELWPSTEEISSALTATADPGAYRRVYQGSQDIAKQDSGWVAIPTTAGKVYSWEPASTYIREPPYLERTALEPEPIKDIAGARILALFGDSVTTDHISPSGAISPQSPAGLYLRRLGVEPKDFNSYASRRGNHEVMVRAAFANIRIKNLMIPGSEGGVTIYWPTGEQMSIYDAAMHYQSEGTQVVIIAGQEYGTGSSRDWAAKGTQLLGVRAVIAQSFERIHRSNLIGMGVLPCQLAADWSAHTLALNGTETLHVRGLEEDLRPGMVASLDVYRDGTRTVEVPILLRLDTQMEVEYYRHGGILPYMLRTFLA